MRDDTVQYVDYELLMWKQAYDKTDEHNCTHAIPT